VLLFTFGCPTRLSNFSLIEACIFELKQFVFVQKEVEKKTKKKTETLVSCISEMAGVIYFKFGM